MLSRSTAESFKERQAQEHLTDSLDLGYRTVEVRKIVGSVNRWQDFDARFRMRNKSTRFRYERIKRAMQRGEVLPPVVLNKIQDKYYVVDGNHRVAVAKEVGQAYIDAHVIEYLPPADTFEHLLWRERSAFERKTNLTDIEFTELGMYNRLLDQIEQFRAEESAQLGESLPLDKAAQAWYVEIYQPVVKQIHEEGLLEEFSGRTEADLFLYATYHKIAKSKLTNTPVSYREALADFHPTPHKSLAEKILDTITGLFNTPDESEHCPYGLILDEDGLVRVKKGCKGCTRCYRANRGEPQVISYDELKRHDLF